MPSVLIQIKILLFNLWSFFHLFISNHKSATLVLNVAMIRNHILIVTFYLTSNVWRYNNFATCRNYHYSCPLRRNKTYQHFSMGSIYEFQFCTKLHCNSQCWFDSLNTTIIQLIGLFILSKFHSWMIVSYTLKQL